VTWSFVDFNATYACNAQPTGFSLPPRRRLGQFVGRKVFIRFVDSVTLESWGVFPQTLQCALLVGSTTETPNVDEDCDGKWDNTTEGGTCSYDLGPGRARRLLRLSDVLPAPGCGPSFLFSQATFTAFKGYYAWTSAARASQLRWTSSSSRALHWARSRAAQRLPTTPRSLPRHLRLSELQHLAALVDPGREIDLGHRLAARILLLGTTYWVIDTGSASPRVPSARHGQVDR